MKNLKEVRETFFAMAASKYGMETAFEMVEDFDSVVSDGIEFFEFRGFPGIGYQIYRDSSGLWNWEFVVPGGESESSSGGFKTRREAMMDAARDADATVLVDDGLGDRIRKSI